MKTALTILMMMFFLVSVAPAADTFYMHIEGDLPQDSTISGDLNKNFTEPLETLRKKIMFSYVVQVTGDSHFFLSLILSPRQPEDLQVFQDYMMSKQKRGFRGLPVVFEKVNHIEGESHLLVGSYVDDNMDPFQQHFDLARTVSLPDLAAWNDYSNEYGFAFLGSGPDFLAYLQKFVADEVGYEYLKSVLSKNNMTALDARLELFLENGNRVSAAFETSPFVPFRFFRNCYSAQHENGMCYTRP